MSASNAIEIGSDLWNARVYGGLSIALELAAGAEKPQSRFASFLSVFRFYLQLDRLSGDLEAILDAAERAVPLQPITDAETYRRRRDLFLALQGPCSRLASIQDRLPSNGKMRGRLERLGAQAEQLLDLADWCDAMSVPEETNAKFESALADLAKGDVVPWASAQ